MIELVDGHAGKAHISSEDMAALNQGVVGEADCVFGYADGLKCSMQTANKASVGKGAGMVGGRRFWVKSAETVSIDSGAPGVKRNDLIVARYKAEASGVESVSLEVVKGSPSPSAPTDPDAGPDALKLWRIPLDGISAGDPQPLFKAVPSLASLRDSLSRRPRVFCGTKILQFGGGHLCDLFSRDEFRREFGRDFDNARDSVSVMNGDYRPYEQPVQVMHSESRPGIVTVWAPTAYTGLCRVNYIVALAP